MERTMLIATFVILWKLTIFMENSISPRGRAYLSGFFLTYFVQVFVHVQGMLPITGLPYPCFRDHPFWPNDRLRIGGSV